MFLCGGKETWRDMPPYQHHVCHLTPCSHREHSQCHGMPLTLHKPIPIVLTLCVEVHLEGVPA